MKPVFVLFVLIAQASAFAPILGLSDIGNGFDQYFLDGQRARIFDLMSNKTLVKYDGVTYQSSYWVQLNNINRYVEQDIQQLHTSYNSYINEYLRSYSFSAGIMVDDFQAGIGYDDELMEVYNTIEQKGQSVGTSIDWWGRYGLVMYPAFIVPYDPIFVLSAQKLPTEAKYQYEQDIVCQFIASYGTDYHTSIIQGGTFKILASVETSYTMKYSESQTMEQMSIGIEYEKMYLDMNYSSSTVEEEMEVEFSNSSSYNVFIEPQSNTYQEWMQKVSNAPIVVNRSLSPIWELLETRSDLRDRSDWLKKTIQLYLKSGKCPSLQDMNNQLLTSMNSKKIIPGLDTVGCGVDMVTLEPKICLFSHDEHIQPTIWTNPYYPTIQYIVPPFFAAVNSPSDEMLNVTTIIKDIKQVVNHQISVKSSSGFLGFGSKSKRTEKYYKRIYEDTYYLARSERKFGLYDLRMYTFPQPPFTKQAQEIIDSIPQIFDIVNDHSYWEQFRNAVGTHIAISGQMGGMIHSEDFYRACLNYEHGETWVTTQVTNRYLPLGCFTSSEKTSDHTVTVSEDYESNSDYEFMLLGGEESMGASNWDMWVETIHDNPRPIKTELAPLSDFISDPVKSKVIMQYIEYYQEQSENSISDAEKSKMPQQTICETNFLGTSVDNKQQKLDEMDKIIQEAKQVLKLDNQGVKSLVGMGYDPLRRQILLPALQLNHNDINVSTYDQPYTWYTTKMYNMGTDVYNEWLKYTGVDKISSNSSVGTEYHEYPYYAMWVENQYDDILDHDAVKIQFDAYNQESIYAIGGIVKSLGAVSFTEGLSWNKPTLYPLDIYVAMAAELLPQEKDDELYGKFIGEWGHGVSRLALYGGIAEQQLQVKKCAVYDRKDWGGFGGYQWQELIMSDITGVLNLPYDSNATKTEYLDYYYNHRKLLYSRHYGGNPEASDYQEWLDSLSKNPIATQINGWIGWGYYFPDKKDIFDYYYQKYIDDTIAIRRGEYNDMVQYTDTHPRGYAYTTYYSNVGSQKGTTLMENSLILNPGCTNCSAVQGAPWYPKDCMCQDPARKWVYYDSQTHYQFDGVNYCIWNYGTPSSYSGWLPKIDHGCSLYEQTIHGTGHPTNENQKNALCTGGYRYLNFDSSPVLVCPNY